MSTNRELADRLDYNPETGVFLWKNGPRKGREAGWVRRDGYLEIHLDKSYLAHRLAWLFVHGSFPPDQIDHINGVKTDNRIANLRAASHRENQQNKRRANATNSTGVLGANRYGKKFHAQISVNNRNLHIGYFDTPEEAHEAYVQAKRRLHPFNSL